MVSEKGRRIREANLIPFNKMSKERQREIASMGGKTVTEKQRVSAWLRANKNNKKISKDAFEFISNMLQDADLSIAQIIKFFHKHLIDQENMTPRAANLITDTLLRIHKAQHGEKQQKTEHVHHVVNWSELLNNCEVDEEDENRPKEASVTDIQD